MLFYLTESRRCCSLPEELTNMVSGRFVLTAVLLLATGVAASSDCSQQALVECMSSLNRLSDHSELSFFGGKDELDSFCPSLNSGLLCIESYTLRCMSEEQRAHFRSLYLGVPAVFEGLCREGPYQSEFLSHTPCMQKARNGLDYCARIYQNRIQEMQAEVNVSAGDFEVVSKYQNRKVCYFLQEYLHCSTVIAREKCGEATAQFVHKFLETMSSPVKTTQCEGYTLGSAHTGDSPSQTGVAAATAPPAILVLLLAIVSTTS